jgi:hypothetical protein
MDERHLIEMALASKLLTLFAQSHGNSIKDK